MSFEVNLQIRASIDRARELETRTHSLKNYVESRLDGLHHSIKLPAQGQTEYLTDFLTRYIDHVPDFIEALVELAKSAGIYQFLKKLIDIAQSYFASPPELVSNHGGLHALIDEAYLAHRLMEEVNDRIMMNCGIPLVPMDMTLSNIVVHHLIGDEFANELDLAVHYSVEVFFEDDRIIKNAPFNDYIRLHKAEGWNDLLHEWPCLAGDSSIKLNLENRPDPASFH